MPASQLVSNLFGLCLDATLKATVLLILAGLAARLLSRSSAAVRHRLWSLTMVGLLLLPALSWWLPAWKLPVWPAPPDSAQSDTPPTTNEVAGLVDHQESMDSVPSQEFDEALIASSPSDAAEVVAPLADSESPTVSALPPSSPSALWDHATWPGLGVGLWLVGVMICFTGLACGLWRVRWLSRNSLHVGDAGWNSLIAALRSRLRLRRAVELREASESIIPLTWGVLRPKILIPPQASGWTDSMRRAVLLHELAHVQRADVLYQLLGRLACAVYWFHPLAWLALRQLRQEREQACDDAVLQTGEQASSYAEQLLEVARLYCRPQGLTLAVEMARTSQLEQRLRAMFDAARSHAPLTWKWAFGSLFAALLLITTLAILQPVARRIEAEEDRGNITDSEQNLQTENRRRDQQPEQVNVATDQNPERGDPRAKQVAMSVHLKASAIDKFPKFLIRGKAGTRTFKPMKNPIQDPLANLMTALDEPTDEADWYRYESTFAWDEDRYLSRTHAPRAFAPDQPEAKDPAGNPPRWNARWGMRDLSGGYSRGGGHAARHVLRASAAEMWKDNILSNPNYLLASTHMFWWGGNSHHNQCFSSIPAFHSKYLLLEPERFDGEACDVVESPTRQERLWISSESGRLRGYLQYSYHQMTDFYASEAVRKITGRSFATQTEYSQWYTTEYERLDADKRLQLMIAWAESMDFASARPSLLVRFRDYREIAPGVWWPFCEDRAQGFPSEKGYECMLSSYEVQEVRTDRNLTEIVAELQPKEGERVQDQRYAVPVDYEYRSDRTSAEILELVDAEYQKQLENKQVLDRLRKPFDELLGKPALPLPAAGWLGGQRPDVKDRPYLIHFWAVWCGPCKNDFPLLKRLAEDGALIVGLHPAGTSSSKLEKALQDQELGYATFLAAEAPSSDGDRKIAGYPATMFPYCVLVDAQGNVAGHGFLSDNNGELLSKFRDLRKAAKPVLPIKKTGAAAKNEEDLRSENRKQLEQADDDPPPITAVRVTGNSHIAQAEILRPLKIKKGQPLSKDDLMRIVTTLMNTRWFDLVEPAFREGNDGRELVIRVVERPVIPVRIVLAEHVLLWEGKEIVTWDEVEQRLAAYPNPAQLQPAFISTRAGYTEEKEKIAQEHMAKFKERFQYYGYSIGSLWVQTWPRYDRIRTPEDLKPNEADRVAGRVVNQDGKPVADAEVVLILPLPKGSHLDSHTIYLKHGRLRNDLEEVMTRTDAAGRFQLYPPDGQGYTLIAMSPQTGFGYARKMAEQKDHEIKLHPWSGLECTLEGDPKGHTLSLSTRLQQGQDRPDIYFNVYAEDHQQFVDQQPFRFAHVPFYSTSISRGIRDEGTTYNVPEATVDLSPGEVRRITFGPITPQQQQRIDSIRKSMEKRKQAN